MQVSQISQNLEDFIKDNKDLVLDIEQDPDKANKLMSKLEDATIVGCNIDKLIIASDDVNIRAYGIKNCNINTLYFTIC